MMVEKNLLTLFNEGPALVIKEAFGDVFWIELESVSFAASEGEFVSEGREGREDLTTVGDCVGTSEGFADNFEVGKGDGKLESVGLSVGDRVGTTEGFEVIPARF
mmetsp:Transcript_28898/g.44163  ORF Transcript_28898/g.44163 Transcript_28898/m.44163 type:complete len:105 (-) Transcript_28898:442-756(-)